jgi:hypothetical protein
MEREVSNSGLTPAVLISMGRRFLAKLLAATLLAPATIRGDIAIRPVTSDFDAEFARAADLLEKGDRAEGESVLLEIRRRANQRAWDARVALLLAADDERRDDFVSAERRLRAAEETERASLIFCPRRMRSSSIATSSVPSAIGAARSSASSASRGRPVASSARASSRPTRALRANGSPDSNAVRHSFAASASRPALSRTRPRRSRR